jgi:hypothetical protein
MGLQNALQYFDFSWILKCSSVSLIKVGTSCIDVGSAGQSVQKTAIGSYVQSYLS